MEWQALQTDRRVLRVPKHDQRVGILSLTFFSVWFVIAGGFFLIVAPTDQRIWAALLFLSAFGALEVFAAWTVWHALRHSLTFSAGEIECRSVFSRTVIRLDAIEQVIWCVVPKPGMVELIAGDKRLSIKLTNYSDDDRRWLVQCLRERLPRTIQQRWPRFDLLAAQLLFARPSPQVEDAGPDYVRTTRRRWDAYFAVMAVLLVGIGVYGWLWGEEPRFLFAPLAAVPVWLAIRFMTPPEGSWTRRTTRHQWKQLFLLSLISAGAYGFALAIIAGINAVYRHPSSEAIGASLAMTGFVLALIVFGVLETRYARCAEARALERAAEVWQDRPPWDPDRERLEI